MRISDWSSDVCSSDLLHDEDLVLRDGPDRVDVDPARQRMEGIEDQADIRMVGAADDFPGIAVVVDMAAPGQRLVADPQAAFRRPLAQFMEILCRPVDAAERQRRDIRARSEEHTSEL